MIDIFRQVVHEIFLGIATLALAFGFWIHRREQAARGWPQVSGVMRILFSIVIVLGLFLTGLSVFEIGVVSECASDMTSWLQTSDQKLVQRDKRGDIAFIGATVEDEFGASFQDIDNLERGWLAVAYVGGALFVLGIAGVTIGRRTSFHKSPPTALESTAAAPSILFLPGNPKVGGDNTMKTITWTLAMTPPVLMFSWLSTSAYLPGLYTQFVFSAFWTLYVCSTVSCLIWGGICILRKKIDYGLISFGLSLIYFCLPALFAPSL